MTRKGNVRDHNAGTSADLLGIGWGSDSIRPETGVANRNTQFFASTLRKPDQPSQKGSGQASFTIPPRKREDDSLLKADVSPIRDEMIKGGVVRSSPFLRRDVPEVGVVDNRPSDYSQDRQLQSIEEKSENSSVKSADDKKSTVLGTSGLPISPIENKDSDVGRNFDDSRVRPFDFGSPGADRSFGLQTPYSNFLVSPVSSGVGGGDRGRVPDPYNSSISDEELRRIAAYIDKSEDEKRANLQMIRNIADQFWRYGTEGYEQVQDQRGVHSRPQAAIQKSCVKDERMMAAIACQAVCVDELGSVADAGFNSRAFFNKESLQLHNAQHVKDTIDAIRNAYLGYLFATGCDFDDAHIIQKLAELIKQQLRQGKLIGSSSFDALVVSRYLAIIFHDKPDLAKALAGYMAIEIMKDGPEEDKKETTATACIYQAALICKILGEKRIDDPNLVIAEAKDEGLRSKIASELSLQQMVSCIDEVFTSSVRSGSFSEAFSGAIAAHQKSKVSSLSASSADSALSTISDEEKRAAFSSAAFFYGAVKGAAAIVETKIGSDGVLRPTKNKFSDLNDHESQSLNKEEPGVFISHAIEKARSRVELEAVLPHGQAAGVAAGQTSSKYRHFKQLGLSLNNQRDSSEYVVRIVKPASNGLVNSVFKKGDENYELFSPNSSHDFWQNTDRGNSYRVSSKLESQFKEGNEVKILKSEDLMASIMIDAAINSALDITQIPKIIYFAKAFGGFSKLSVDVGSGQFNYNHGAEKLTEDQYKLVDDFLNHLNGSSPGFGENLQKKEEQLTKWQSFSATVQEKCEKCGIYTGRDRDDDLNQLSGLRLTHMPAGAIFRLNNLIKENLIELSPSAGSANVQNEYKKRSNYRQKNSQVIANAANEVRRFSAVFSNQPQSNRDVPSRDPASPRSESNVRLTAR